MQQSRIPFLILPIVSIMAFSIFFASCSEERPMGETHMTLYSNVDQSPGEDPGQLDYEKYADLNVPPLPPEEALGRFELEDGFRIEVVAHEPMISDPVAMDIDADGRLWVVDMPSYMPVADMSDWETAVREQVPKGRVLVLEDTTGDGMMDTRRVFHDELILPRAIKVLNDGVLVGEPPNVWFIRDTTGDGKGDTRERVYDTYGDPNVTNAESLPNALMWGMDNWMHSADNNVESLRRVGGEWQVRPFQRLGQWGMTQDNWGQLYSASNARPLQSHLVPYGYSERHPQFDLSAGVNESIAPGEPLWPAHAVGSNRSYRIGTEVREDGTLRQATSTLGPVVYRGHQFGEEYDSNVFTPEPAANMIKRYLLNNDPAEIEAEAEFAYEGREFLTSTDERFRPTNMYNSPDGALYVVDMYRGIIQHARFMTDHLREYALERDLHVPFGTFGRIYRIVRDEQEIDYNTPKFSELTPSEIVDYLKHDNGLLRDQAQQVLVQSSPPEIVSTLEDMVLQGESEEDWTRLHALWTLDGFEGSVYSQEQMNQTALEALEDSHPRIRASAIRILEPMIAENFGDIQASLEQLVEDSSSYVQLQLLASLGESNDDATLDIMAQILEENADSPYFREMALTGVYQREEQLAELLRTEYGWNNERGENFEELLTKLAEANQTGGDDELLHLTDAQREIYKQGSQLYNSCSACHGAEGQGVSGIAPALEDSEWALSDPEIITRIVLNGFVGGVAENPRSAVNISGQMPAHAFLSDDQLAAILTYIRQSWGNEASPITPEEVADIRQEVEGRQEAWTPDELRELP